MLGNTWWRPIVWSVDLLNEQENIYVIGKHHIIDKLTKWRKSLSDVASYSFTPVPLVYTQVFNRISKWLVNESHVRLSILQSMYSSQSL